MRFLQAARGVARKDLTSALTDRVFTLLSMIIPMNYLVLLIIIVASGARAPIAVVMNDQGPAAQVLLNAMGNAHSFIIHVVDGTEAARQFDDGHVVAIVTLPATLGADLQAGRHVSLPVTVNNLDIDFTDDIRRAIPLSITTFSAIQYPGEVQVQPHEVDARTSEPSYLQYVAVSSVVIAVALGGMLIAGTQAAREYETGTLKTLLLAPSGRLAVQCGRIAAGLVLASGSVLLNIAISTAIIGAPPAHPVELLVATLLLMTLFVALGNLAGNVLRRRPAVVPLCAGVTFPLFAVGGAFQPVSWGHPVVAAVAHLSPTYYGLAVFQHAFHGATTTPQSVTVNMLALVGFTVAIIALSTHLMTRYEVDH